MSSTLAPVAVPDHAARFRAALAEALPELTRRARRMTASAADADDLVQETMLRALRFESTFRPGTNLRAWTHQILRSVVVTRGRHSQRTRRALERFGTEPSLACSLDVPPT